MSVNTTGAHERQIRILMCPQTQDLCIKFNLHLHLSARRKELIQHRIACLSRCFIYRHNDWADNTLINAHN
jgi:hypothetical protein